jgi:hypothetical protein
LTQILGQPCEFQVLAALIRDADRELERLEALGAVEGVQQPREAEGLRVEAVPVDLGFGRSVASENISIYAPNMLVNSV